MEVGRRRVYNVAKEMSATALRLSCEIEQTRSVVSDPMGQIEDATESVSCVVSRYNLSHITNHS